MNMIPVSSSNLVAVGYDPDTQTLRIEFYGGRLYDYYDVPQYIYTELMNAPSYGEYHAARIKNHYRYSAL